MGNIEHASFDSMDNGEFNDGNAKIDTFEQQDKLNYEIAQLHNTEEDDNTGIDPDAELEADLARLVAEPIPGAEEDMGERAARISEENGTEDIGWEGNPGDEENPLERAARISEENGTEDIASNIE